MPPILADYRVWLVVALVAMLAGAAVWFVRRRRVTPEERERRRRLAVNRGRRTIEGYITEASEQIIHFQYELRGVAYFASQDVSTLRAQLPADPARLIGPASVRFEPRNPANSIVVCEEWSGLPLGPEGTRTEEAKEKTTCN